jgi:hypothetical protein
MGRHSGGGARPVTLKPSLILCQIAGDATAEPRPT